MVKRILFLVIAIALVSCKSEKDETNDVTTVDDLPKGEWNGEYYEVKDTLTEEKKPKKKSRGSEYFNMGTVEVNIDTMQYSIDLFHQKKNHITISKDALNIRIKSAQRDFLSIHLMKPNIIQAYSGTYKIDPNGAAAISSAIDFRRLSSENEMELTMVSGTTKVESFSPKLGKLVLTSDGVFKDKEGNEKKGKIKVNMRFESIVSTYNPNS